jgi:hypothetical protein
MGTTDEGRSRPRPEEIRGGPKAWVAIAIVVVIVVALSSLSRESDEPESTASNPATLSRSDLGNDWPLTVDEGVVSCEGGGEVYFTADGTTYAVNGLAQGNSDLLDIDAIWADASGGLKKNMGPIIDAGLELC